MDTFRSAPLDVELVANTKHSRSEPQSDLFFQAVFFQSRTIHTLTMIHNDIYMCVWKIEIVWYGAGMYVTAYGTGMYLTTCGTAMDGTGCYRYVRMGQLCYACNVNVVFMRCHVNQCNVIEPKICL